MLGGKDTDRWRLYFRPQGAKYLCANFIPGFLPLFSVSSTLSIIFTKNLYTPNNVSKLIEA